jgi:hypothetical protein
MSIPVPDHRIDPDTFNAWALMYLDRALSPEQERAFAALLASDAEAGSAFARACEMDTSLFEDRKETSAAQPRSVRAALEAELLDPANAADLRFVSQACRVLGDSAVLNKIEKIPPAPSVVLESPPPRRHRVWQSAALTAAASLAVAALTYIYIISGQNSAPTSQSGPATRLTKKNSQLPHQQESDNKTPQNPPAPTFENRETHAQDTTPKPEPHPEAAQPSDIVAPQKQPPAAPRAPELDTPDLLLMSDPDHAPATAPAKQPPASQAILRGTAADPAGARLDDAKIWRTTGDAAPRRSATRVEISLAKESENESEKERWHLGGLVCTKTFAIDAGAPYLRLTVDSSVLSNPALDFEFIVTNQPVGGKIVALSVRPEQMEKLGLKIDLAARRHTFEIVVHKFNQFELRIDGQTSYFHTAQLNKPEWAEICLGFRAVRKGHVEDGVVAIENAAIGYGEARK